MLVLSRKALEKIIIRTESGEVIEIVVREIRRSEKVRLGFTAPLSISIHREEVDDAIQRGEPQDATKVRRKKTDDFHPADVAMLGGDPSL